MGKYLKIISNGEILVGEGAPHFKTTIMNDNNIEQEEFYKLYEKYDNKSRNNFNKDKINEYIEICKRKIPHHAKDYYVLKRFNVWSNSDGETFLINKNNNDTPPAVFISSDGIYKFIKKAHDRTFHAGIKKTYSEVRKMVNNVKIRHVKLYISLCYFCQNVKKNNKNNKKKKKFSIKSPIISKSFNQRAQVDLIDVKGFGLGKEFSYVLNYQDNLTKFCILKPLADKHVNSIKISLMEIFNLFGAPKILHSDNGGEFRGKPLLDYFNRFWPNMTLVRGKPYNPRSQGSVERANGQIKDMILSCISNGIYDFKSILLLVQYVKNTTFNRTIKCTPYYALFGQDVVVEQYIENIFSQMMMMMMMMNLKLKIE